MDDDNLAAMLADTARLMRRSFDARAKQIGVTRPQWRVLSVLRRFEGVNQGGLAELLEVEPITVCRMVDRLQDAQLVERRPDPADRRSWLLFLTPKAQELLGQLRPLAEEMLDEALEGIGDEDRIILTKSLDQMRRNLARKSVQGLSSHG
jgi:DNA-binding MarR family transcriptional regulator